MKPRALSCFAAIIIFSCSYSYGQEKSPVKFGKVSIEDFNLTKYNVDSSANAVVISEIGSSEFTGNTKGWFSLVYKVKRRVKMLNKNGFEASNVSIPLYSDGNDLEKLSNLKAITYNLENGQVVKTELDDNAVFKDKLSKNLVLKKFTFPAVKEGSIIEYSYTITSDFLFNLQTWEFEGVYPRIWSEYEVSIPEYFDYVNLSQGYREYSIKSQSEHNQNFIIREPWSNSQNNTTNLNAKVLDYRWVMKDVPAINVEGFTSSIRNHVSRIEFQHSQNRFPNQPTKDVMGNWSSVSEKMLHKDDFGSPISGNNNWLNDDLKVILGGATDPLQKAKIIYAHVRDNFTCTDYSDVYMNNSLKTIYKEKNGSVSDINLLLIAMLRNENIGADPVILSTRDHGYVHEVYPLLNRYNYIIVEARINGTSYYLDASQTLGFGKLPQECYNGYGMLIAKEPREIAFMRDSLKEAKLTSVRITASNGKMEGVFQSRLGYYESLKARETIKEKGEAVFFKNTKAAYNNDIEITNPGIDSLKIFERPLVVHYEFNLNDVDQNIIYFNPMMTEGYKNNFFTSAERKYPIEMPYTMDETYILSMDVPTGYEVEEVPKSEKVFFNVDEGFFEYLITKSDTKLQLRSKIVLKRADFGADEYNMLRDFFGFVVKKHSEQIVFKKKS